MGLPGFTTVIGYRVGFLNIHLQSHVLTELNNSAGKHGMIIKLLDIFGEKLLTTALKLIELGLKTQFDKSGIEDFSPIAPTTA
jgi:hypothetical protein